MILLFGGTSETAPLASALARNGYAVLVSTATDEPLSPLEGEEITRRSGPLDATALALLIRERGIRMIVDATHPYALLVSRMAREVADSMGIPYFRYGRPTGPAWLPGPLLRLATDHKEAAVLAFEPMATVLLTTGSRNLTPYADESRRTGVRLLARVLPRAESLRACEDAGLLPDQILAKKGPFSTEETLAILQEYRVGVLVTKDSGEAGGVPEKLAAAEAANCRVVMISRPKEVGAVWDSIPALVASVLNADGLR